MTAPRGTTTDRASLALVGLGPRGASVLERLGAVPAVREGRIPLDVHLIDPEEPGPGAVWRVDQPRELLMNSPVGTTTLFPPGAGPSLFEWCRLAVALRDGGGAERAEARAALVVAPETPADFLPELRGLGAESYPSRAVYGLYLRWFLRRAAARLPPEVRLAPHRARATDIEQGPDGRSRVLLSDGTSIVADAVVLSLGWLAAQEAEGDPDAPAGARRIRPAAAADQPLETIAPGERVVVRGFGMNFFDSMALLTLGRGGRFTEHEGALRYVPSGREPVLHVGSGRGAPYRSKPEAAFGPRVRLPRTTAVIAERSGAAGPVELEREVLPAIRADTAEAYYRALAETEPEALRMPVERLVAALGTAHEAAALAAALADPARRLSFAALDRPLARPASAPYGSPAAFDAALHDFVAREIAEGRRPVSPVKLASAVLGASRKLIAPLVRGGGLAPGDYNGAYARLLSLGAALAGGPPPRRMEELLALLEAGVVRGIGPGMRASVTADGVAARSPEVNGSEVHGEHLLEAWMHRPAAHATADPLLLALRRRGRLRPHRVGDAVTGAVDVDPATNAALGADGMPDRDLTVLGIPTEGVHVFTIVSPIIEPESAFLRETDELAARLAARFAGR